MFDQTPVNRLNNMNWSRAANHHSGETDIGGVRHLLADITELAELQVRLVAGDTKCLADSMVKPAILGVIGLVVTLGAIPVLLLAVANALVEQFAWSPVMAQLTAAGAALLIAAGVSALAISKLKACGLPLRRSFSELEKNMHTLREMLVGKGTLTQHLEELERQNRQH